MEEKAVTQKTFFKKVHFSFLKTYVYQQGMVRIFYNFGWHPLLIWTFNEKQHRGINSNLDFFVSYRFFRQYHLSQLRCNKVAEKCFI
jgi:hypothetical protein